MKAQHLPELTPKRILTRGMALMIAGCVAVAAFVAFLPALENDFVDYDDRQNFVENEAYRGLGKEQLKWMWTPQKPQFMGHYHPLTWMTLGFDYTNWDMEPFGYHLTSNIIHAINSGLFFLLALRLLRWHRRGEPIMLDLVAATSAAMFWAVHPMRVESVAWITERRDLVNGFFALLAVLAYVRAMRPDQTRWPYLGWLATAWLLFIASLLGKAMTITLPVLLLILDWYPLRRFGRAGDDQSESWFSRETLIALAEKVPFFAGSLFFAMFAAGGQAAGGWVLSWELHGLFSRITACTFGLAFYVWKTLVPIGLLPIYEIQIPFNPFQIKFGLAAAFVLAAVIALWMLRKRWPAAIAAAICYVIILSPVLGLVQNGLQIAADRYTYLAAMPLMVLAGGGMIALGRRFSLPSYALAPAAGIIVIVLGVLTAKQCLVWQSTESLWTHTIEWDKNSSYANNSYGYVLRTKRKIEESIPYLRRAIEIQPLYNREAYVNLWDSMYELNQHEALIHEYRKGMDVPSVADVAHYRYGTECLGRSAGLASQRRQDAMEAAEHFQKAIDWRARQRRGSYPEARNNLALALTRLGELEAAEREYRQAIQENPQLIPAHYGLAVVLNRLGRRQEAIDQLRVLLRLSSTHADGRALLSQLLAGQ